MNSVSLDTIASIAAQATAAPEQLSVNGRLETIDEVVTFVAFAIVAIVSARWLVRSRHDPLRFAAWRPNTLREDGVAFAVFVYLVAVLLAGSLTGQFEADADSDIGPLAASMFAQIAGAGACVYVGATRFAGGWRWFVFGSLRLGLRSRAFRGGVIAVVALGICPVILELSMNAIAHFWRDYSFPTHATISALERGDASFALVAALWVGAALIAPVAEELFFRGLVQTLFLNVLRRRWAAIVLTSLVFGAIHFSQAQAVLPLVVLSLLLGYAYEKSGSLVHPIAIHAAFNLKTLIWFTLDAYPTA